MLQHSRPAQLRDVPLRRLLIDAHVGSRLKIARAAERIGQGGKESLHKTLRPLPTVLPEAPLSPARQGLKHPHRMLQQHLYHRQGRVEISVRADQQSLLPVIKSQRKRPVIHLAEHRQDHREAKEYQPQSAHRGDDVVAEQRGILRLRLRKESVEPPLLLLLQVLLQAALLLLRQSST